MLGNSLKNTLVKMLEEYQQQVKLPVDSIFVVGCSTSEVMGNTIGTSGALSIAEELFEGFNEVAKKYGWNLAFQGCEHINRALVVERKLIKQNNLEEVAVVPVRTAGGSMAAHAFQSMQNPTVVEFIKADGGIDIGNTLIGMHLRHVAVPVRISENRLNEANVVFATTRPKLIGGERAVYKY